MTHYPYNNSTFPNTIKFQINFSLCIFLYGSVKYDMKTLILLFSEVPVKAVQHFASHPFAHTRACCQINI